MKKIILSLILISTGFYFTSAQEWIWAKQFSSSGTVNPLDIVVGPDNNIYVAGLYNTQSLTIGSTTLPYSDTNGKDDLFLCSFAPNGSFRWARQIAGEHMEEFGGIAVDNNSNIYFVGSSRSATLSFPPSATTIHNNSFDGFLAKYDNSGNLILADTIFWGNDAQRLKDVAVDFSNNYLILVGNFKTEVKYYNGVSVQQIASQGPKDNLVARYDLSGNFHDIKTFKGSAQETVFKTVNNCVYGGNVQGYFVTGDLKGKLFLPGDDTLQGDAVNMDAMAVRFDNNLNYLWSRRGGGTEYEHVNSAGRGTAGNIYISGKAQSTSMTFDSTATLQSANIPGFGGFDYYLAKYNRNGYLQWIKRKGGSGLDNAYGLAVKDPRVVTAGNIDNSGNIDTGFDLYDVNGNLIISDVITGNAEDQGQGVAFDVTGDSIYLIGYFKSTTLNAGPLQLTNTVAGLQDGFLVKYGYKFKLYLVSKTNITCNGSNDGYIKVGTQFGVSPITYAWTPNVSATFEASGLSAGTYKIVATDGSAKKDTIEVEITQPTALSIATDLVKDASCYGGTDGEIRVTVSGGTTPRTLTWSGPGSLVQGNLIQTGLVAGSYTLDVEDANGCTTQKDFEVGQASKITFTGSVVDTISIPPGCNGAIDLTVAGGTPGYTYSWSSGPTTQDISGLCLGGTYNVTVTDTKSCVQDTSFNVPSDTTLNIYMCVKNNVSCKGESDGKLCVCVASGGTGNYLYEWRDSGGNPKGGNSPCLEDQPKGTYYVTVTDIGNGKSAETSGKIEGPANAMIAFFNKVTHISCFGKTDGYIDLEVSGGWGGYEYKWMPGDISTQDISKLSAGPKYVTVTDAGGCKQDLNTTIIEPTQINANITIDDSISCHGESDGALWAHATGGTKPYTYFWDDEGTQNDSIATDLYARQYFVRVVDNRGCSKTTGKILTEPGEIIITLTPAHVKCNGGSDGAITAGVSGGTQPYSYAWDDGPTTKDRAGLTAGTYCLTVTDYHGCTGYKCETINEPAKAITIDLTDKIDVADCYGDLTGSVMADASGGTGLLTYTIHPGDSSNTTGTFVNLPAGTYTVSVMDANGCGPVESGDLIVNQPAELTIVSENKTDVTGCYGDANGSVIVTATGGSGTLTYTISPGDSSNTTGTFVNLPAGTYTVCVTDANGCGPVCSGDLVVSQPDELTIDSEEKDDVACYGDATGSVMVNASGGTVPLTYTISPGDSSNTTGTFVNLPTGSFMVSVTDANGCGPVESSNLTITQPDLLVFLEISIDSASVDLSDGVITITASGGTRPYSFFKNSSSEADSIFENLAAGDYVVRVDDANGCTAGDSTVNVPLKTGLLAVMDFGKLLIYPNPTTGKLTIEIENKNQKDLNLEIINLRGQVIWKKELQYNGEPRFIEVVDMSQQARGTYFMRINGLAVNTKIILE